MTENSLGGLIIGGGVALLCIVLGIVLLSGHGFMLIAGYNTMSPEERKKVNIKSVAKAVGIYMILTGLFICGIFVASVMGVEPSVWLITGFFIGGAAFLVIYINVSKRFKN
jgi:hypothetical protein